jgi:hypothetical protein
LVLKVRGLGEEQLAARMLTEGKIVSFLSISPFTYQQLWKVSNIHRNILRKRLDSLIERQVIFKHKYSIPYESKFYGSAHKYLIPYWSPLCGHVYYLLNCSTPECNELIFRYLSKEGFKSDKDHAPKKGKSEIIPSFSFLDEISDRELGIIGRTVLKHQHQRMNMKIMKIMNEIENKVFEIFYWQSRYLREFDLTDIKNGRYHKHRDINKKDLRKLDKIIKFFSSNGYGIRDILIRCSIEMTYLDTRGGQAYLARKPHILLRKTHILDLPMIRYSILWEMTNRLGLLNDLT